MLSPRQAVATHGVAGGGAVALLEAVDEGTVQTGLALLQAAVLFEATAPAGHAPGIFSIAEAAFLKGLNVKNTPAERWGWFDAMVQMVKGGLECGLLGVLELKKDLGSWDQGRTMTGPF